MALLAGRPEAARADSKREVSPEERLKIEQALPVKAPAAPKKARKLLVFTLNVGYGEATVRFRTPVWRLRSWARRPALSRRW